MAKDVESKETKRGLIKEEEGKVTIPMMEEPVNGEESTT